MNASSLDSCLLLIDRQNKNRSRSANNASDGSTYPNSASGYMTQARCPAEILPMSCTDMVLDPDHPGNRQEIRASSGILDGAGCESSDCDSTLVKEENFSEHYRQPDNSRDQSSPINHVYVDVHQMSQPYLLDQHQSQLQSQSETQIQQHSRASSNRNACCKPVVLQPVNDADVVRRNSTTVTLRETLSFEPTVATSRQNNFTDDELGGTHATKVSNTLMNIPPSRQHNGEIAMAEQQFSFMTIQSQVNPGPQALSQHQLNTHLSASERLTNVQSSYEHAENMPTSSAPQTNELSLGTPGSVSNEAHQVEGLSTNNSHESIRQTGRQMTTPGMQPVECPASLNRLSGCSDSSGYLNMSPVVQTTTQASAESSAVFGGSQRSNLEPNIPISSVNQQNQTFSNNSSLRSLHSCVSNDTLVRKLPLPMVEFLADHLSSSHSPGWRNLLDLQGWTYDKICRFEQRSHEKGPFYSLLREAGFERLTVQQLLDNLNVIRRKDVAMDFEDMIEEHNTRAAP